MVQAEPSASQGIPLGRATKPQAPLAQVAFLQISVEAGQSVRGTPVQTPATHLSLEVQPFPSLHEPLLMGTYVHIPVAGTQTGTMQSSGLLSAAQTIGDLTQTPWMHRLSHKFVVPSQVVMLA